MLIYIDIFLIFISVSTISDKMYRKKMKYKRNKYKIYDQTQIICALNSK